MLLTTEIQLVPDKTFVYQLVIFLAVVLCLNYFVFKPILKIINLRRAKTEGDRKKIEQLTEKTENLMKEYEAKMQEAKLQGLQIKEAIRREGDEQGHRMVQEAKQAGLAQTDKIKKEIEAASQKAAKELQSQAEGLGKNLAEKVLGRSLDEKN